MLVCILKDPVLVNCPLCCSVQACFTFFKYLFFRGHIMVFCKSEGMIKGWNLAASARILHHSQGSH